MHFFKKKYAVILKLFFSYLQHLTAYAKNRVFRKKKWPHFSKMDIFKMSIFKKSVLDLKKTMKTSIRP